MLTHNVPTKMRLIFPLLGVGGSTQGFALGVDPIMLEGDSISDRASTMIEGNVTLYGEQPVTHNQSIGTLTHLPRRYFSNIADDRWTSPYLAYKPTPTSTPIGLGNYRVPRGGTLEVVPPWHQGTPNEHTAKRYFIRFSGFVIAFGGFGGRYVDWNVYHYNEDFSNCTRKSGTYIAPIGTKGDWKSIVSGFFSDTPSGIAPSTQGGTLVNVASKMPSWMRLSMQRRGPSPYLIPRDPEYNNTLGLMTQEAIDSLNAFNSNGNAYISEAMQWRSLLPPVKELKTLWKFKSMANVYLWLRFGVSLSVRDTKALIIALPRVLKGARELTDKKTRLRSRKSSTLTVAGREFRSTYCLRVLCDSYPDNLRGAGRAIDTLYSLDVVPTLDNLWDMIPLSFVVDWLIPVSEVLQNIDLRGRLQSFSIHSVTISRKWVSKRPQTDYIPGYITTGTVEDVWYSRTVQSSLPLRGVFSTSPSGKTPTRRFIDASALIIQKGRP